MEMVALAKLISVLPGVRMSKPAHLRQCDMHFGFLCGYVATFECNPPLWSIHRAAQLHVCDLLLASANQPDCEEILIRLQNRCCIWPSSTKKKTIKAICLEPTLGTVTLWAGAFQEWAGTEAGVIRGMAVHALQLARRATGSEPLGA